MLCAAIYKIISNYLVTIDRAWIIELPGYNLGGALRSKRIVRKFLSKSSRSTARSLVKSIRIIRFSPAKINIAKFCNHLIGQECHMIGIGNKAARMMGPNCQRSFSIHIFLYRTDWQSITHIRVQCTDTECQRKGSLVQRAGICSMLSLSSNCQMN
jgi:hypothetical protein